MVRIAGLNHYFGVGENRRQALCDINLALSPGEIVIMTGPSGSGKTTLLVLIGALRSIQEGTLEVMGHSLRGRTARDLVEIRRGIGFIFQFHNLFESLTAIENVKMAMELHPYTQQQRREMAEGLLTTLGLEGRFHDKPGRLSGGQKQRIAVARALVNRPRLILADEPTAALDKESGRTVVNLLKAHAKEHGGTIILVTHDNRILDVADRIVTLVDGRIASSVIVDESMFISEFLKKCSLFQQQTPGELTEIAQKMARESFAGGAVIIRQGDVGDKFYLIRRGEVEVVVSEDQGEQVVAGLHQGEIFGEAALLTNQPRNATVRAKGDVEVYTLDKDNFLAALKSSISFKHQMLQIFATREAIP
jgi:putative ABC transport system ATP-binding protein